MAGEPPEASVHCPPVSRRLGREIEPLNSGSRYRVRSSRRHVFQDQQWAEKENLRQVQNVADRNMERLESSNWRNYLDREETKQQLEAKGARPRRWIQSFTLTGQTVDPGQERPLGVGQDPNGRAPIGYICAASARARTSVGRSLSRATVRSLSGIRCQRDAPPPWSWRAQGLTSLATEGEAFQGGPPCVTQHSQ